METKNPRTAGDYKSRINRVFDYIEKNIDQQFTLEELAELASFSKFHFHRIFYALAGETPFQFILRLRLEKAAFLIRNQKNETLTDKALKCGFSDIASFSRNFKKYFKESASQFRKASIKNSNLSQILSKIHQEQNKASMYFCMESKTIKWKTNMELNKSVEVKELPKMTVAYIRHLGPYKGDEKLFERLWNKLFGWAGPRGILQGNDFKSLIIYHDDPSFTDEDKLRMSVCLTVAPDTKVDGEIGKMELEAGKYVVARFELSASEFETAWQWVYAEWLPNSDYQPDDKPSFEMCPEEPKNGKFVVDICVPIKPL